MSILISFISIISGLCHVLVSDDGIITINNDPSARFSYDPLRTMFIIPGHVKDNGNTKLQ